MKIIVDFPPNIEKIDSKLGVKSTKGILYCYGDTIFNPWNEQIPIQLTLHEKVHSKQQGTDPEGWWNQYLEDKDFRFVQELEAHQLEWKTVLTLGWTRPQRQEYVNHMAKRLSGKMYGNIISWREAKNLIREIKNGGWYT